jgi:hypothetical protein
MLLENMTTVESMNFLFSILSLGIYFGTWKKSFWAGGFMCSLATFILLIINNL